MSHSGRPTDFNSRAEHCNENGLGLDPARSHPLTIQPRLSPSVLHRYRPRYDPGIAQWVLYIKSLPDVPSYGVITRAARKQHRWQMDFVFPNREHRKYYLCTLCFQQGHEDVWIGYKNFVHQHIPRHHAHEACLPCPHCHQPIYAELHDLHQRTCLRRSLASSNRTVSSSIGHNSSSPTVSEPSIKNVVSKTTSASTISPRDSNTEDEDNMKSFSIRSMHSDCWLHKTR